MQTSVANCPASADDLVRSYQRTGTIVQWPVPDALRAATEVTLRNVFAEQLARQSVAEIVRRYVYLSTEEMERLLRLAFRHVLPQGLRGTGIELGAGCGLLAAVASKQPAVRAVLALEVCERFAELLIGKVARGVLGAQSDKVVPVVGSFDDLHLPDESLDFAVENDSLHHSGDLAVTMSECARVLKPGGVLLCFDRCHPNRVSDAEVDALLSKVYSREFLVANCYPPDIVLTRRENGEHEYRLFEWEAAANAAGVRLVRKCEFEHQIGRKRAVKGLLAPLPRRIRRAIYQSDNATLGTTAAWIGQELRARVSRDADRRILAPKRTTVLLFSKP